MKKDNPLTKQQMKKAAVPTTFQIDGKPQPILDEYMDKALKFDPENMKAVIQEFYSEILRKDKDGKQELRK